MKLKSIVMLTLCSAVIVSCGQQPDTSGKVTETSAPLRDIAVERPDEVSVLFRNEYVRVLRFDLDPNEALPAHVGNSRLVYSLNDYVLEWTENDDAPARRSWKTGDVHAHEADVHAVRNTGATSASFLVFERLDTALPSAPVHDESSELPVGARSLLSSEDFDVLEIVLQPGENQAPHEGGWRAVYSLSDYTIEWRDGEDDNTEQKSWRKGDVHWHEPAKHAASNIGDSEARWVVVGFKD